MSEISMVSRGPITPSSSASSLTWRTQIQKIVDSDVFLWDPNMNPITALSREAKGKKKLFKEGAQYYWSEDEYVPFVVCINNAGGYDTDDTSIILDSAASVVVGDVLAGFNPDGTTETMLVTTISTNTITVTRGLGGTAINLRDNQVLYNLGQAHRDKGVAPEAITTIPNEVYNYLQVMRTAVDVTSMMRTQKKYYPEGDYLKWQLKKKVFEHNRKLEMAFLLGHRGVNTSAYLPLFTTQGIWERLDSADSGHKWNVNGTLTRDEFYENGIDPIRRSKGRKIMFSGRKIIDALSGWHRGSIEYTTDEKVMGLKITKIRDSMLDDIDIIWHPWMDKQIEPANGVSEDVLKNWAVIVDWDYISYCYGEMYLTVGNDPDVHVSDTKILPVDQASNIADSKYEIISIFGTQIKHPNAHQIIYGVEGYV